MLPMKYCLLAAAASVLLVGPVAAQTAPAAAEGQSTPVRIQTNLTFFLPGAVSGEELPQKIDQARKIVYQLAMRECEALRSTIARDCKLESVNSNIRQSEARPQQLQQSPGYHVSGSIQSVINLKSQP
ncbi:hypothetical protein SR870_11105 [Rhodopseudomonas palustris]|uniref:hypothetical protein n=1 Tax=Rhodopseudomonas palustris TaxID=1076 RepID=UPI002ACDB4DA|nr:hypothetical protein [Rhodopseudomonas palustris]WQH01782.1 hypothetical protein SR870_11105 [Rhodopseudomonas palustris]